MNDILPRAQAWIESDGGAFECNLKSFKKKINRTFFIADISSSILGNRNNNLINSCIITHYFSTAASEDPVSSYKS